MKTIKLKECRINSNDLWIIGILSLLGLSAGLFVPQTSVITFVACLMVGVGLGLVISALVPKNQNISWINNNLCKYQF